MSGVVDTFAPAADPHAPPNALPEPVPGVPPRTPILFTYHEGDSLELTDGRSPAASDEIIVDTDMLTRAGVALGDSITLRVRNTNTQFKIVGTFALPGVTLGIRSPRSRRHSRQPLAREVQRKGQRREVRGRHRSRRRRYTVASRRCQLPGPTARAAGIQPRTGRC